MTKQEFIDKWTYGYEYLLSDSMMQDLDELLAEQEDINVDKGYQKGWKDAAANCPKEWSENN